MLKIFFYSNSFGEKMVSKVFEIDIEKEEKKHKRTLSHFLAKFHEATGDQNKDVAEKLGLDKSYYNKVRLEQIAPLTNSIITLKRFASLNQMNLLDFIAEIEEMPKNIKEDEWASVIKQIMSDLGPTLRRAFIHNRLSKMLRKDKDYTDVLMKCFVYISMLIDLTKHEKWFNICTSVISQIHYNLGLEKSDEDLKNLIERIKL